MKYLWKNILYLAYIIVSENFIGVVRGILYGCYLKSKKNVNIEVQCIVSNIASVIPTTTFVSVNCSGNSGMKEKKDSRFRGNDNRYFKKNNIFNLFGL